jgi:hypothetical protein
MPGIPSAGQELTACCATCKIKIDLNPKITEIGIERDKFKCNQAVSCNPATLKLNTEIAVSRCLSK